MKFLVVLCLVLALHGTLSAVVSKRDVSDKTKDDEEAYGPLDEEDEDVQKDQVEYYDDDVEESPADTGGNSNVDVKLISKGETFTQKIGEVVYLPCQAASKGEPVRVWSKGSTVIYQSNIKFGNKNNYKLLENGTLKVDLEDPDDFGPYACKLAVSQTSQPEIVHRVVQLISPEITELYTNDNKKVYNIGETLVLTCIATGNPKPRISWHRNNERLGPEGETLTMETLTIPNVKAKQAGTYRCLADNGVGEPNHKYIEVFVNHSPMVSVEDYIVNTAHGSDAQLVCEVKAYPAPRVNWQRNGENIGSRPNKIELQRRRNNEKNILIIRNIEDSDFGQYSCAASNEYGDQVRSVNLVKTPAVQAFEKQLSNESTKDVILQWKVESKQPISMHELQYRRKGETNWKTITPEVGAGDNDVYLIEHTLKNLEPSTYETRARSKNSHGWSDYSEIMPFIGAKHGSHHPKVKHTKQENDIIDISTRDSSHDTPAQHRSEEIVPVGESISASSSTSVGSSIALIAIVCLILHVRQ